MPIYDQSPIEGQNTPTDPNQIRSIYTELATNYNGSVAEWGYDGPQMGANLMKKYVPTTGRILDAGCGTGLTGEALQAVGYQDIIGIDLTPEMLKVAEQTGHYTALYEVDLAQTPYTAFPDNYFQGLNCVGVLSYLEQPAPILREFCRLVEAGGYLVFTKRNDLYDKYQYEAILAQLGQEGLCQGVLKSKPKPYLPQHRDFTDQINVLYLVYKVLK